MMATRRWGTHWRQAVRPLVILSALTCWGGCATRARVDLIDLNFKRIEAKGDLVESVSATDCFWWCDGKRLYVALHEDGSPLATALTRERFDMSFVLDGMPAERSRDYRLDQHSLRAVHGVGANHSRYASLRGVVGVWLEPGQILRGRFRLLGKKQIFHILTGWSDVGQVVVTGEFRCRRDQTRGEPVLARTEEGGMERRAVRTRPDDGPRPVEVHGPPVDDPDERPHPGDQPR